MSNAAKHLDPVLGVDFHVVLAPPAAQPTPVPVPYVGVVFDPFDYLPFIGATVMINGLPRAQAGTGGMATPTHFPLGGPFGPPPPSNESEVFMGSSTVAVDGDAQSFFGLPALSCQSIGMPAPFRPKGQPPKSLVLPTSSVLSIPSGLPVMIGGPPTISLTALGMRGALAGLGKLGKGLRRMQRGSGRVGKAMAKATEGFQKAGDALANAIGLGAKGRNAIDRAICTVTGHPVDVATGKVFTDHIDFALPGPLPVSWERVWYSTSTYDGPLGHGWHHSYDAALYVADDVVLHRTPDGRLVSFPPLALGDSYFDPNERLTLIHDADGYAVRAIDRSLYRFRDIGRSNAEHVLHSISNPVGHAVRLFYSERGLLVRIVDSAQRALELTHDARGHIASLNAPNPDDPRTLISVSQYQYDAAGNLASAIDPLNQAFRYTYEGHLLAKETDRNGLSFHFGYDGKDENARCVHTWGDDGIYDHRLDYDLERSITTVTNSLGHKSQYQHRGGLVVRAVDAYGSCSLTEYDEHSRKLKEIDPQGRGTSFRYDDRGNMLEVFGTSGRIASFTYDANDQIVGATDAVGGEWVWGYDAFGRLTRRIDPLGHTTSLRYEGRSLAAVTDAAGGETQFGRDAQSNLCRLHTADGAIRQWEHDGWGRTIAVMDPNGNTQRYRYDDLNRLTRIDDPSGDIRTLRHDAEGNIVHIIDGQHDVTFKYQGLGKLTSRTQAGTTVSFEYDTEEQLVAIKNEHGDVYRFELGLIGEVLSESGFDGVQRRYERDRAGRISALVRAGGAVSHYRYDYAGRVSNIEHSDGTRETYRYRADGELMEATNQSCTVRFERDLLGRVVRELCGEHWIASEFDPIGNRIALTSSLGASQRVVRNPIGEVLELSVAGQRTQKPFTTTFKRDALGAELERNLPGGARARWQRDRLGRPVQHELEAGGRTVRARSYRWDQGDRLQKLIDSNYGTVEYARDARGQLAWARYSDGSQELRIPDALGNLFRTEDRSDRRYGPAGQLLEMTDAQKRVTRYAYDAEGNLIEKVRSDGQRWRYRWNAAGTLREVERPDGRLITFAYDPFGRRISKTLDNKLTRWVWDTHTPLHEWIEQHSAELTEEEHEPQLEVDLGPKLREALLGETTSRGPPRASGIESAITWLFEPEGFAPIGKLVGSQYFSIITDHVGTPIEMVDARGDVCWSVQPRVSGEVIPEHGDPGLCPFRFQGQYEDPETGLHYNYQRYYDPEAGLYISQDPIGLRGGRAFYAYVPDPTGFIDPLGLACRSTNLWNEFQKGNKGLYKSRTEAADGYKRLKVGQSPYPDGFVPQSRVLPPGTQFRMALAPGQPSTSPGKFGTFDVIPNQTYVRQELAVKEAWKPSLDRTVTYETTRSVQVLEGPVGPQLDEATKTYLPGGGTQIELVDPAQRMSYLKVVSEDPLP